jgi:putative transposase
MDILIFRIIMNRDITYDHLAESACRQIQRLAGLAVYPWCGHAALMNKVSHDWLDREYVLQFFGRTEGATRKEYLEFLESEMEIDREQELSGGGLIRSQGG